MSDFLAFFHFQIICSSLPSVSLACVLVQGFSHLGLNLRGARRGWHVVYNSSIL